MANIPVERKGGAPWWTWLLALLALLGLIWLLAALFGGDDDAEPVTEAPVGATDGTMTGDTLAGRTATTGAITSLSEIWRARQQGNLYGREVRLTDVEATNVAGDSTFFIRNENSAVSPDDAESRLLVVLQRLGESETDAPGPEGSDGRYNINEGERVDIEGRVDRFAGSEPQVTGEHRDRLMPDSLYINARRVTSDEDQVLAQ